jgi:eukaryotic-like serine/threonine-protein kinase
MGTVWEAHHLSLDTSIAIKFLNTELSHRPDIRSRFAREATSAARIRSPHVVGVLDSGFTEQGRAFIAMEFLRGEDLGRRLLRQPSLTLGETVTLVGHVCRGLAKAHAAGIVHRDLKPENLFMAEEEDEICVKILDFGIAKAIGPELATHKTDTGQLLGTPTYMSPEQALGRAIDSRSDLYSLAVVAYRCLAGRPPFVCAGAGELLVAVSTHTPRPPSRFNRALSPSIDRWFERALAHEPSARAWQHAADFGTAFEEACRGDRGSGAPAPELPRTTPASTQLDASSVDEDAYVENVVASADEVATTVSAPPPAEIASPRSGARPWAAKWVPAWATLAALSGLVVVAAIRQNQGRPAAAAVRLDRALPTAPVPAPGPATAIKASVPPSTPAPATEIAPVLAGRPADAAKREARHEIELLRGVHAGVEIPAPSVSASAAAPNEQKHMASTEPANLPKAGLQIDRSSPW